MLAVGGGVSEAYFTVCASRILKRALVDLFAFEGQVVSSWPEGVSRCVAQISHLNKSYFQISSLLSSRLPLFI